MLCWNLTPMYYPKLCWKLPQNVLSQLLRHVSLTLCWKQQRLNGQDSHSNHEVWPKVSVPVAVPQCESLIPKYAMLLSHQIMLGWYLQSKEILYCVCVVVNLYTTGRARTSSQQGYSQWLMSLAEAEYDCDGSGEIDYEEFEGVIRTQNSAQAKHLVQNAWHFRSSYRRCCFYGLMYHQMTLSQMNQNAHLHRSHFMDKVAECSWHSMLANMNFADANKDHTWSEARRHKKARVQRPSPKERNSNSQRSIT